MHRRPSNWARHIPLAPEAPGVDPIEELRATTLVLRGRLSAVERSNCELRTMLGLDAPPPPLIGTRWVTTKEAAACSGFSESGIRSKVRKGEIAAVKTGGRVLLDAATIPARRTRNVCEITQ